MWCTQRFAIIADSTIQNIIVCDNYYVANDIAREAFGENACAIDVSAYAVGIGDTFDSKANKFYRDEEEIEPEESIESKLARLEQAIDTLVETNVKSGLLSTKEGSALFSKAYTKSNSTK